MHIKGVNLTSFKAICECKLNNIMDNNIFGNNFLIQSSIGEIKDMISNTNIEVIRCYKDIFNYKYYISNFGWFIIMSLILSQIILVIIYYSKSIFSIRKSIFELIDIFISYLVIQNHNLVISNNNNSIQAPPKKNFKVYNKVKEIEIIKQNNNNNLNKKSKRNKLKGHLKKRKKNILKNIILKKNIQNNIEINTNFNNNNDLIDSYNSKNFSNSNLKENSKRKYIKLRKDYENLHLNKITISNSLNQKYKKNSLKTKNEIDINMEEYLRTEIDEMDYDDAIKRDKRTFCQYFYDKLKINQLILSTFLTKEPLRPKPLKILLFILNIDLYFFINGLFFNEDYISEMFKVSDDEGVFPFIERFMSRFFYITLVGVIIGYIIECFFIDEKK